jgi:hypothetical protein
MTRSNSKRTLDVIAADLHKIEQGERGNIYARGRLLIEAREAAADGTWTQWLADEFDWSDESARRYMAAARLADRIPHSVESLKVPKRTIYTLALDYADDPALSDIVKALAAATKDKAITASEADGKIRLGQTRHKHGSDLPEATLLALSNLFSQPWTAQAEARLKKEKPDTIEAADDLVRAVKKAWEKKRDAEKAAEAKKEKEEGKKEEDEAKRRSEAKSGNGKDSGDTDKGDDADKVEPITDTQKADARKIIEGVEGLVQEVRRQRMLLEGDDDSDPDDSDPDDSDPYVFERVVALIPDAKMKDFHSICDALVEFAGDLRKAFDDDPRSQPQAEDFAAMDKEHGVLKRPNYYKRHHRKEQARLHRLTRLTEAATPKTDDPQASADARMAQYAAEEDRWIES